MEQPLYTVAPRGHLWRVLKWEYLENGAKADVVEVYFDKETARKKARELNTKKEPSEKITAQFLN